MPYKNLNGIELYYETSGEGEPLLFIHGLGSSTRDWQDQVKCFSDKFQTVTVDLRGHGQTEKPPSTYSISLFASDVAALIEEVEGPVHVAGISMGGMVALQLAVDYPEMVKSLILINTQDEVLLNTRQARQAVMIRKVIPRLMGMKWMGKYLGKKLFPEEDQGHFRELIANRWAENSVKDYTKSVNAIAGWSVRKHLQSIKCPVLVVASELDYTPVGAKEVYVKILPDARLEVIKGARHAVSVERPEELNKVMMGFLRPDL
ncbi:MAG: alpha/beta hydrolase [Bacteroidetes bacterium]|nr:MAG: alpha/beta hydrolase [Bacteroidota bacterium]